MEQIDTGNGEEIAEVQYFFQVKTQGVTRTVALVSKYSPPIPSLLTKSHGALVVCKYQGLQNLKVIHATSIKAVVAMVPYPSSYMIPYPNIPGQSFFFLVERMGLDIATMGGYTEEMTNEGEDDHNDRV